MDQFQSGKMGLYHHVIVQQGGRVHQADEVSCWHRRRLSCANVTCYCSKQQKITRLEPQNTITEHVTESCLCFSTQVFPLALEIARCYTFWEDMYLLWGAGSEKPASSLPCVQAGLGAPSQVGASTRPSRKRAMTTASFAEIMTVQALLRVLQT